MKVLFISYTNKAQVLEYLHLRSGEDTRRPRTAITAN